MISFYYIIYWLSIDSSRSLLFIVEQKCEVWGEKNRKKTWSTPELQSGSIWIFLNIFTLPWDSDIVSTNSHHVLLVVWRAGLCTTKQVQLSPAVFGFPPHRVSDTPVSSVTKLRIPVRLFLERGEEKEDTTLFISSWGNVHFIQIMIKNIKEIYIATKNILPECEEKVSF